MTEKILVEVWSDIACPFCYIGKRRFEEGAAASGVDVEVRYRSYLLDPGAPQDRPGGDVARLMAKFGITEGEALERERQLAAMASEVGLEYDFAALQPANTTLAQQLLHYAKARGVQGQVKERLLAAHFTQGRHVGRVDELAKLAGEAGLDAADVARALSAGEHLADVEADIAQARAYGITSVPFFVLGGKYAISGAQDPAAFAQALTQIRDEGSTTA